MKEIQWQVMFSPELNLFEIIIRGTAIYLTLYCFMRLFRRNAGSIGIADLLVVVLIADAAQNAMGSDYKSITEGVVLVATILFWNYMLDWLPYRFPIFKKLLEPAPILLVKDGKMIRRNLQKEMITKEELMSQIREQGVESIEMVKLCHLETDGKISVIAKS